MGHLGSYADVTLTLGVSFYWLWLISFSANQVSNLSVSRFIICITWFYVLARSCITFPNLDINRSLTSFTGTSRVLWSRPFARDLPRFPSVNLDSFFFPSFSPLAFPTVARFFLELSLLIITTSRSFWLCAHHTVTLLTSVRVFWVIQYYFKSEGALKIIA